MSTRNELQDCIRTEMEMLGRLGDLKKELDELTKKVTKLWHETDDALDTEQNEHF